MKGGSTFDKEACREKFNKSLELLEATISATEKFLVGDNLTIADLSVASTVTVFYAFADIKKGVYPKIDAWLERLSEVLPQWDAFNQGAKNLVTFFEDRLVANVASKN